MRVVFMGTPDFAVGTLQALLDSEHEVVAVVTQPDKPKGRGKSMQFTPVKELSVASNIPVYQPKRVREDMFFETLKDLTPDVIVVVAFGQIIPERILELPRYGCVNVHASLLPKYRGAAPIQWAVIDGERVSGVTTMQMDAGLDTGDMLLTEEVVLAEDETGGSLFDKLSCVGAQLLIRTLKELEKGTVTPRKQPKDSPTPYAAMLDKTMGRIDWNQPAEKIERLVRGLNPWPSAYTKLGEKTLKIWRASVEKSVQRGQEQPGTVVWNDGKTLGVQTGDGVLIIEELQLEGKKRMAADAFLRGYSVEKGVILCC
ncbi:MAG: methionyl-tRNA formyltransferase [Eubacteriales bacterium]|nr:methionyl-tRNA formyltransferase [Eubacteriales bacterium]